MKVKEIIDSLCNHEICKLEAVKQLTEIIDGFRRNDAIEFHVEEVGFLSESKDGYLKLRLPYEYHKIEKKINKGDKVDVMILPYGKAKSTR